MHYEYTGTDQQSNYSLGQFTICIQCLAFVFSPIHRQLIFKHFCFAGSVVHVAWTKEEKEAVFKHLSSFVRQGRYPGKRDCENCILKANGVLHCRRWCAIKYFVKNQIDKRKRVLAPKNQ